jgi:hypothetical protein
LSLPWCILSSSQYYIRSPIYNDKASYLDLLSQEASLYSLIIFLVSWWISKKFKKALEALFSRSFVFSFHWMEVIKLHCPSKYVIFGSFFGTSLNSFFHWTSSSTLRWTFSRSSFTAFPLLIMFLKTLKEVNQILDLKVEGHVDLIELIFKLWFLLFKFI